MTTWVPKNLSKQGGRYLEVDELPIEFLMNALRLHQGVPGSLFSQRTGLDLSVLQEGRELATSKGLLEPGDRLQPTPQGRLFLNDLLELFA